MLELITRKPESEKIAERIADAQAKIAAAETQVPALRDEDKRLEGEIAQMLGEQIAEGETRHGAAIAAARERRRAIATEIEELAAGASAARAGIEAAKRVEMRARIRETRERARTARKTLASRLDRAGELFRELWTVDQEVREAAFTEWRAWDEEMQLRQRLDKRDAGAPPHSDVEQPGSHIFDQAYRTLLAHNDSFREEGWTKSVAHIAKVAAQARAANDAK